MRFFVKHARQKEKRILVPCLHEERIKIFECSLKWRDQILRQEANQNQYDQHKLGLKRIDLELTDFPIIDLNY